MNVNNQLRPVQDHQPVKPANQVVPPTSPTIKVKTRSSERMQELQQNAQSRGQDALGSKAQIALIKARIEAVPVRGIADQSQRAPMSNWTIAARVLGGIFTAGISELVINRQAIGHALGGAGKKADRVYTNFSNNIDYSVGERYIDAGNRALAKAGRIESMLDTMSSHDRLTQEVGGLQRQIETLNGTEPKTGAIHQQIRTLTESHQAQSSQLQVVQQSLAEHRREFGEATRETLNQQMGELRRQGGEALEIGRDIKGGRLEMAEKYGAKNLLKIASLGHGVFSLVNSVAIIHQVREAGSNILHVSQATQDAAAASIGVSQSAIGIASVVAAPVTVLLEGRELYQTGKALKGALSKVEMANALVSQASREQLRTDLTSQLNKAQNGGWFSKPNPTKAAALQAKLAALDRLPPAGEVSEDVRAMADQIKKHADTGHKRHTMIKNTVAITAGVLTIAAFAMGPAAPVGLALAATVLGVGAAVYGISLLVSKFRTSSQRSAKVETLNNNHAQIQLKRTALTTEKGEIAQKTQELTAKKDLHTARIEVIKQFQRDGQMPSADSLQRFADLAPPLTQDVLRNGTYGNHLTASQNAIEQGINPQLAELNQRNSAIDGHLGQLADLRQQNAMALMRCSPHDAAERIYTGAMAGDHSMKFLAEHVLRVDIAGLPPDVAREQLVRGMSLNPET